MMQSTAPTAVGQADHSRAGARRSHLQAKSGAVLLAGLAMALCLFVVFIGVLQNAVERGESFRQQLGMTGGTSQPPAANSGVGEGYRGTYSARFSATPHGLGAPVAPALMLAVQGSR